MSHSLCPKQESHLLNASRFPQLLTKLLCHVRKVLNIPVDLVLAWTNSIIVLSWLAGNPHRFKTYIGNRVSFIIDQFPPHCWRQNPADCTSVSPSTQEIILSSGMVLTGCEKSPLNGYSNQQPTALPETIPAEEKEICTLTTASAATSVTPVNRFSKFTHLKKVTAWMLQFVSDLHSTISKRLLSPYLTMSKLNAGWLKIIQMDGRIPHFEKRKTST